MEATQLNYTVWPRLKGTRRGLNTELEFGLPAVTLLQDKILRALKLGKKCNIIG